MRKALEVQFYPETDFGGFSRVDGTIAFYTRVNALLRPEYTVLDIGCGRGAHTEDKVPYRKNLVSFKGKVERVIGIDVDPNAAANPTLDDFRLIEGARWPVDDLSIDLARCDFVLEHIENPAGFFAECARVIKPGGYLCIRTPNRHGYVAALSRLIPERFHQRILNRAQGGTRQEADVFRTHYRCNTRGALERHLTRSGFTHVVYAYEAEPSYLRFSAAAYAFGKLLAAVSPPCFRNALFCFARRNDEGTAVPCSASKE